MPYCSHCGNQVAATDAFCGGCGTRQPAAPVLAPDPLSGLTPRTASILCYVPGIGWIASIYVLSSMRFRAHRTVRFHAFQGLYLFVAWLIEHWVMEPVLHVIPGLHIDSILKLILLGISIFM